MSEHRNFSPVSRLISFLWKILLYASRSIIQEIRDLNGPKIVTITFALIISILAYVRSSLNNTELYIIMPESIKYEARIVRGEVSDGGGPGRVLGDVVSAKRISGPVYLLLKGVSDMYVSSISLNWGLEGDKFGPSCEMSERQTGDIEKYIVRRSGGGNGDELPIIHKGELVRVDAVPVFSGSSSEREIIETAIGQKITGESQVAANLFIEKYIMNRVKKNIIMCISVIGVEIGSGVIANNVIIDKVRVKKSFTRDPVRSDKLQSEVAGSVYLDLDVEIVPDALLYGQKIYEHLNVNLWPL